MATVKAGKKGVMKKKRTGKKAPTKTVTKTKAKVTKRKGGSVQKVWDICNANAAKFDAGVIARKDIIAKCVAAGLNAGTAGTQFAAWTKAR